MSDSLESWRIRVSYNYQIDLGMYHAHLVGGDHDGCEGLDIIPKYWTVR